MRTFACLSALLLAPSAVLAAGWTRPEASELRTIYGLRRAIEVDRAGFLVMHPEQWSEPFIGRDASIVYVATDGGALRAIWIGSGEDVWQRKDLGRAGRGMAQHRDDLLVGFGGALVGLEGFSGKEKWRVDVGGVVGGAPIVDGAIAVVPVRPNGYAAVDLEGHKLLWKNKRPVGEGITLRGHASPLVDRAAGLVYVGYTDGFLAALRLDGGEELWRVELGQAKKLFPDVDAGVVRLGGLVVAASYNGGLAAVEGRTGRVRWRRPELERLTALVAPPESTTLVAAHGDGEVLGIEGEGVVRWRYRLEKGVPTGLRAIGHGLVAVSGSAGPVALLEVATGKPRQLIPASAGASTRIAHAGAEIAVLTDKGRLLLLRHGEPGGATR